jgi:hypothetical protein
VAKSKGADPGPRSLAPCPLTCISAGSSSYLSSMATHDAGISVKGSCLCGKHEVSVAASPSQCKVSMCREYLPGDRPHVGTPTDCIAK